MPCNGPSKRFVAVERPFALTGIMLYMLNFLSQKACLAIWRLLSVELNPASAGWFQIKST